MQFYFIDETNIGSSDCINTSKALAKEKYMAWKKKKKFNPRLPLPKKTGGAHRDKTKYRRKPKHKEIDRDNNV